MDGWIVNFQFSNWDLLSLEKPLLHLSEASVSMSLLLLSKAWWIYWTAEKSLLLLSKASANYWKSPCSFWARHLRSPIRSMSKDPACMAIMKSPCVYGMWGNLEKVLVNIKYREAIVFSISFWSCMCLWCLSYVSSIARGLVCLYSRDYRFRSILAYYCLSIDPFVVSIQVVCVLHGVSGVNFLLWWLGSLEGFACLCDVDCLGLSIEGWALLKVSRVCVMLIAWVVRVTAGLYWRFRVFVWCWLLGSFEWRLCDGWICVMMMLILIIEDGWLLWVWICV